MSARTNASVPEAFDILYGASDELLRSHRTKITAIIRRLQPLIKDYDTTTSAAKFEIDSKSSDISRTHSTDQPTRAHAHPNMYRISPTATSRIEGLISILHDGLQKTREFLSQVQDVSIKECPIFTQDQPQVIGNQERSPLQKLRRGLSQRSLAFEFDRWEKANHGASRITDQSTKRLGRIADFVRTNEHRFYIESTARKGIEFGIKLLICERVLKERGISAILFFYHGPLRSITATELSHDLGAAIEGAVAIKELAQQQTSWLDQRQSDYDTWYKSISWSSKSTAIKSHDPRRLKPRKSQESGPNQTPRQFKIKKHKQHVSSLTVCLRSKIPENLPAKFGDVTPMPAEQTLSTSSPSFSCSSAPILTVDDPALGDTSTPLWDPSSHIQTEYPFSALQVMNTFSNPSSYTQTATFIDSSYQEQIPAASFNSSGFLTEAPCFISHDRISDPSSYIQENPSVNTLGQEEIFNPSSYIQENEFVTLYQGQPIATACELPSFTYPANLSTDAQQEQIGTSPFDPSKSLR